MALTTPNPSNINVSFPTRADFIAATIPTDVQYVMAGGLLYVRDATGTALTDANSDTWSPTLDNITPDHFGENTTPGTTDMTTAIQAAIDWCGVLASTSGFLSDGVKTFGPRVTLEGNGNVYAVSSELTLDATNRNLYVDNLSIVAIGSGWALTDYIFNCGGSATYITFNNLSLNCANKCGGVSLEARCRLVGSWIDKVGGIGANCSGSDVWIDRCIIGQFTNLDPEYYDPSAYTGTGIYIAQSDARVTSCTLRWLNKLIQIEHTNNIIQHCHMFNGMQGYTYDQRSSNVNAAIDTYFGWPTGTAATTNIAPRDAHIGIEVGLVAGDQDWVNTFDNVYFDNCHHELYVDGVIVNNCKFGAKKTSSLLSADSTTPLSTYDYMGSGQLLSSITSIEHWFRLHAWKVNANPTFQIRNFETYVSSANRHIVKMVPKDGFTWNTATSDLNTDTVSNMATNKAASGGFDDSRQVATGFTLGRPYAHWYDGSQGSAVTYRGMGQTSSIAFLDDDTTGDVTFGVKGEHARIKATNGSVHIGGSYTSGDLVSGADSAVVIKTGDSGVAAVDVASDDLIIENNVSVGISLCSPTTYDSNISFYDETKKLAEISATDTKLEIKLDPAASGTGAILNINGLPTSSAGLASGDIWLNSNVLTIVP